VNDELVSIIMPAFNCSEFILESIQSVQSQTYTNWELIVVDDCSSDGTDKIAEQIATMDSRIKLFRTSKNSGAAITRNKAIKNANGRYIAFLDSDDIWKEKKLENQLKFMADNEIPFSCTAYDKIDRFGNQRNRTINVKIKQDYNDVLRKSPGNSTVIYDASVVGVVNIPDIRKRNDYVMWLQIVKRTKFLYGLDYVLSSYRVRNGSISRNKFSLVKYQWQVYRDIEKLSIFKSVNLVIYCTLRVVFKLG